MPTLAATPAAVTQRIGFDALNAAAQVEEQRWGVLVHGVAAAGAGPFQAGRRDLDGQAISKLAGGVPLETRRFAIRAGPRRSQALAGEGVGGPLRQPQAAVAAQAPDDFALEEGCTHAMTCRISAAASRMKACGLTRCA